MCIRWWILFSSETSEQRLLVRIQYWYNFIEVLWHKYYAIAVSLVLSILDDSCTNQNFPFRRQVYNRFGVVTSFTSTYRANKWSLELSSSRGNQLVLHLEPEFKMKETSWVSKGRNEGSLRTAFLRSRLFPPKRRWIWSGSVRVIILHHEMSPSFANM